MTPLAAVAVLLRERGTPFALIGAGALAIHGVNRATTDLDLLVVDPRVLEAPYWTLPAGFDVSIRPGDADDPLAGIVRVRPSGAAPLDVVVGKAGWQQDIVASAVVTRVLDVDVPVAAPVGLVLLKLFAGGPQDLADVVQLVQQGTAPTAEVDAGVADLPADAREAWARVRPPAERSRPPGVLP